VGVAYSRNKLALHARLRNLNLRSQISFIVSEISTFIFTIGIDNNNTFKLKFVLSTKIVGAAVFGAVLE